MLVLTVLLTQVSHDHPMVIFGNNSTKLVNFIDRVTRVVFVFVRASNECIMYVLCITNASQIYHRCNISTERPGAMFTESQKICL